MTTLCTFTLWIGFKIKGSWVRFHLSSVEVATKFLIPTSNDGQHEEQKFCLSGSRYLHICRVRVMYSTHEIVQVSFWQYSQLSVE